MDAKDIQRIAIATAQFLDFVEEIKQPMFQGYDFIDYTLLCVHCEAFTKLTEDEAVEVVKALGFTVLPPIEDLAVEPTFALSPLYDEETLRERVEKYIKEEC